MIRHILFDFDYTLADSSEGIIASVNFALTQTGQTAADPQNIRRMIGHSLEETFAEFVDPSDKTLIQRCKTLFMEFADTGAMVQNTVLLKDVPQTLARLTAGQCTLGIVSTKRRSTIEDTLRVHSLAPLFKTIIGYEDVTALKPHPEGIRKAMLALSADPQRSIYVGDSPIDVQAGRNAGIPVIAVASGMNSAEDLKRSGAERIIRRLNELPQTIGL